MCLYPIHLLASLPSSAAGGWTEHTSSAETPLGIPLSPPDTSIYKNHYEFSTGTFFFILASLLTPHFLPISMGNIMPAIILDSIPVTLDPDEFQKLTHVDLSAPSVKTGADLIAEALPTARPKAMYKVCYMDERTDEEIELEGIRFTSTVLSRNLRKVERVFPYVVTCGVELDSIAVSPEDVFAGYMLDGLKELVLRRAIDHFRKHLAENYGLDEQHLSTMNPGSGNRDVWPISQQRQLFQLLGDVEASIGVGLKDSYLMTPNKTVSGILFPTEVPFVSCQLCTRENCPRRRAQYTGVPGLAGH
jgi:hypothetical protein